MSTPDQGSVFSGSDQGQPPEVNAAAAKADSLPEAVALLVGEGRKYRTLEDLAKGYVAADGFVETLKGENATLRTEIAKAATLEEVMKRLKAEPSGGNQDPVAQPSPGMSAVDVAKIVREQVSGIATEGTRNANLQKADASMKQLFGEKAKEMFDAQATSPEKRQALMALAAVDPATFIAVFAPQAKSGTSQVDGSTNVNTAALNLQANSGRATDPGCKEYYDTLRKAKPAEYYSSAVQLQMNRAAGADRSKFFGK